MATEQNSLIQAAAYIEVSAASGGDKYDMFGNDLAEQCETAIRALKD